MMRPSHYYNYRKKIWSFQDVDTFACFSPSSLLLRDHEELKAEFHFPLRFPALLQLSVMFLFTDVAFAIFFHKDVKERSFHCAYYFIMT